MCDTGGSVAAPQNISSELPSRCLLGEMQEIMYLNDYGTTFTKVLGARSLQEHG